MRIFSLRALLLTGLITMHKIALPTYVPAKSGLFRFSFSKSVDHAACHECLINSLGCAKLYLLQVGEKLRLYWVEAHVDILSSFLSHCHAKSRCTLNIIQATSDNIIEPRMAITQLGKLPRSYEVTETALFSLVKSMPLIVPFLRPLEIDADSKHKCSTLMLEKKGSIPFFFDIELKKAPHIKNSIVILEPVPETDADTHNQKREGDSSIRCMIIPGPGSDAVCRECLAMHSKWLAIRSYILFHKTRRNSAELVVFPSNYESSDIVMNCRMKSCFNLFSWNPRDCEIMDSIFPRHRELLEVHQKTCGLNKEHHICNENTMDLNRIRQVLNVTAFGRMQRASKSSGPPQAPFSFSNTVEMLRTKKILCIDITLSPPEKWGCIGCILRTVGGARLVTYASLRNAMILTSDIKRKSECSMCSNVMLLEPEKCHQYRYGSVVSIESFPKPSDDEVLDERVNNCFVLHYGVSYRVPCLNCMKKAFSTKENPYALSITSSLVDTSNYCSELPKRSLQNLLTCHQHDKCVRIQKVPFHFCSNHADFLPWGSFESIVRDATMKYTQIEIPVGIWPSQKHYVLMSHSKSERGPNLSPVYSSRIALVHFEYARSTFEECAKCLVGHTEVFFAYDDKSTSAGYVWMRPTPSSILRICVGKVCSRLSYNVDRKQVERPVGNRQLTNTDICIEDKKM